MKKTLSYLKPYKFHVIGAIAALMIQAISNLILPNLNASIINNGVALSDTGYVLRAGAQMLAVSLVVTLSAFICSYCAAKASSSFGADVRRELFKKVESFSLGEVGKFGAAGLITRTTNDMTQLQNAVQMMLRMLLFAPVMCVGGIIMAVREDVKLSALIVVIVPVILILMIVVLRWTMPLFTLMQSKIDKLNLVMREKLSGVRVIRAFIREVFEERRFDRANRDLTDTQMKAMRIIVVLMPAMTIIMNLATLAVYWFGTKRIDSGGMQIGSLTAFSTYVMHILFSIMMSSMMFVMLPRAAASARRVAEVLETDPAINDPETPALLPEGFESLIFRDVTFSYPGAEMPVLSHIDFSVGAGETLAIIGSTGSGKSTLLNLIPRLYDVTEGQVLFNGVDIRATAQNALRARLGFVPQRAFLFEGTVRSNLLYGSDKATEADMWHALEVAQGRDFVEEKGQGLEYGITQGGTNLSGGQRQRMAIARALIRKPDIYIFDDSFSALDFKTDAALRHALRAEMRGAAVIIVAQRVSTIMTADRILVLDSGSIAGSGTHAELMETCAVYREIVLSQLSEEEVAS